MNYNKEELAREEQRQYERAREIQRIRWAVSTGNVWSEYHPETIRKRIAEKRQLLAEALSV